LSFPTISDLNIKNTDLTDTVFGNVTSIICHNLKDPNTAEYVSSVFGTCESEIDFNDSSSQMGSVHSVEEFIVHPNELKQLKIGDCYLKTTLPTGKSYIKKSQ
jgi:type IV secretory pathway TraG/TraD family ATPase VirD4